MVRNGEHSILTEAVQQVAKRRSGMGEDELDAAESVLLRLIDLAAADGRSSFVFALSAAMPPLFSSSGRAGRRDRVLPVEDLIDLRFTRVLERFVANGMDPSKPAMGPGSPSPLEMALEARRGTDAETLFRSVAARAQILGVLENVEQTANAGHNL